MSLLQRLNAEQTIPIESQQKATEVKRSAITGVKRANFDLEAKLHKYLIEELERYPDIESEAMIPLIRRLSEPFFDKEGERMSFEVKTQLLNSVIHELTGLGPITELLDDPTITEVMVNGPYQVYVEKDGKLLLTDCIFRDNNHVQQVIDKIVSPIGRRIDESSPYVDARLADGSRVNAIIPPLALNGPTITIRKFSKTPFTIQKLIEFGTLDAKMAMFLEACVKGRLNIFISGGTGSGKTSTLNVLSSFIPRDERIVTIEDAAELKLSQEHVISLEVRPPNIEGQGEVSVRDLVRNSLRMRPDRIIIGEVRSAETLDMLQALNTGHDGSLATGHANSPRDMLARLETMVLMANVDLPIRAIREQVSRAIHLIIHQSRMKDGTRKITHITEVQKMEGDTILLQDLFVFRQTGYSEDGKIIGQFVPTGIRPLFEEQLAAYGQYVPMEWFRGEW